MEISIKRIREKRERREHGASRQRKPTPWERKRNHLTIRRNEEIFGAGWIHAPGPKIEGGVRKAESTLKKGRRRGGGTKGSSSV